MVEFDKIKVGDTMQLKPAVVTKVNKSSLVVALEWPDRPESERGSYVWIHISSIDKHIPAPEKELKIGDRVIGIHDKGPVEIIGLEGNVAWCRWDNDPSYPPCYL